MAKGKTPVLDKADISVEEKLVALFQLQTIDSEIDRIKTVRGELPLEVNDLEDIVTGLETRIKKYNDEIEELEGSITEKKNTMKDANALIKKYEGQQSKVRNNREYDSLTKEIEFQNLEIQLSENALKNIRHRSLLKKNSSNQAKMNSRTA
jgi:predicted  nucleic acid-binding Zn-ribbon protein